MKIAVGSDHGGFELKEQIVAELNRTGHSIENFGCHSSDSVDYPDFAERVCESVRGGKAEYGILICGTGIGMSIAANRHRNIRAALCHDEYTARLSREHNNANVICIGARVTGVGVAKAIVKVWFATSFAGGRHKMRVDKFSD